VIGFDSLDTGRCGGNIRDRVFIMQGKLVLQRVAQGIVVVDDENLLGVGHCGSLITFRAWGNSRAINDLLIVRGQDN